MGCAGSKDPQPRQNAGAPEKLHHPKASATSPAVGVPGSGGKLLDKYTLGKVLGQGAFGVVYKCKKKGSDEEFAVKMIDQVETPLAEIKREAEMLTKLAHHTVIKLHDVFYEKVFVCMVLEYYKGGDMIQGMMAHWKTKGMIPIPNVRSLSKQMHAACAWLHSQSCVHRDVKGDNFMMDKPNVENPQQRLYLSDFGTVRQVAKDERITQKCGTKNYWPPEFYRLNYGIKVDCWAVGVVMFGLVSGKFPFKGEDDVKYKKLVIPKRCPDEGHEIINKLLERDEEKRMECAEALTHRFLQDGTQAATEPSFSKLDTDFTPEIKERGANAGVAQRRAELVDRLQNADGDSRKQRGSVQVNNMGEKTFVITDPVSDRSMTFEWRAPDQAKGIIAAFDNAKKMATSETVNREVTEEVIRQQLEDHNVKVGGFGKGKAKQLSDLVREVQEGSSRILLDATKHKFVVRAVDVVLLRIVHGQGSAKRLLIETTGGKAEMFGNLKTPVENALQAAERLSKQMLGPSCKLRWEPLNVEAFEEVENSPAYPGLQTVYRKEIMSCEVLSTDPATLRELGLAGSGTYSFTSGGETRTFEWLSEAECLKKSIKISAPKDNQDFSALVYPPIGLEEEELNEFLSKNDIDTSRWGQGTSKTLEDFSEELVKGESTLIKQASGKIARVVDIVVLHLTRQDTGEVLVEVAEKFKDSVQQLNRLPAVKRRSDEHQFIAARRMVTKYLKLEDNRVNINPKEVRIIEEEQDSKSYHGLSTIYRKRYMKGTLIPDAFGV